MKKIKVAFFAEMLIEDYDGAARTMFQIIDRIPQDRFEFLFICGVPPVKKIPFEVFIMPTKKIPFQRNYEFVFPYFSKNKMKNKLDDFQPDIIHIASPSPLGKLAQKYGKQNNVPVIAIYHTHFLSYIEFYLRKIPLLVKPATKIIAKDYRNFYDNCDLILIPTEEMIADLKRYNHRIDHMEIWRRGIDKTLFNPSKRDEAFLKNIVKNEKQNVIFVSRLVWEKNLDTVIGIAQAIDKSEHDFNFIIAGDGVARDEMESKMPNAIFLGNINHEDLSKLYATADVFVFPSITETYGNVVIEAMASGIPCVIANGGGSSSFIDEGKNGFLCEPKNPNDYLEKVTMLLQDEDLQKEFIKNGLAFVQDMDWDSLVATYFSRLEEVNIANQKDTVA